MPDHDQYPGALPAYRAFVVHFGSGGRTSSRRFAGRVEHLSSGESIHFSSLKELLAFIDTHLAVGGADRASG